VARELLRKPILENCLIVSLVSEIKDGDFSLTQNSKKDLQENRAKLSSYEWNWLSQEHGTEIIWLNSDEESSGLKGDALVTASDGKVIAVSVADCLPVLLICESGIIALIHLGWRGVKKGLLDLTIERIKEKSLEPISAVLGPSIGRCCYEFGEEELLAFVEIFGERAEGTTTKGRPSLDLKYCVKNVLRNAGIYVECEDDVCTSCDPRHWSYRQNSTEKRQVMIAWKQEGG